MMSPRQSSEVTRVNDPNPILQSINNNNNPLWIQPQKSSVNGNDEDDNTDLERATGTVQPNHDELSSSVVNNHRDKKSKSWWSFLNRGPSKSQREEAARQAKDVARLSSMAAMEVEDVLAAMDSSIHGLSKKKVESHLERFGPNTLSCLSPTRWYTLLWKCLLHPFNFLLLLLAISNIALPGNQSNYTSFGYLLLMVVLAVSLRFYQELKSTQSATLLNTQLKSFSTVLRQDLDEFNGVPEKIDQKEVVPGDIIRLQSGDLFPGDCRVLISKDLFVGQSSLTGESLPVEKTKMRISELEAINLLSCDNICLKGTSVVSGTGLAIVLATGDHTYLAHIGAKLINPSGVKKTAFDRGVLHVSYILIGFMVVMVPIVILIQGFSNSADGWVQAVEFGITVAVGLTPEMLPMVVNANLAKGARSLMKRNVIVKELASIQNLGAMDILCCDKTGTLTKDQITLIHSVDGMGQKSVGPLKWGYLNSVFETGLKNLLDRAIIDTVEAKMKVGEGSDLISKTQDDELVISGRNGWLGLQESFFVMDEIPFDFERRRLSVVLAPSPGHGTKHTLVCKGASEEILSCCSSFMATGGKILDMTEFDRENLLKLCTSYNEDGLRVLAVATRVFEQKESYATYSKQDEVELVFQGFLVFLDPPKESTKESITRLTQKGIEIKVLTGDNLAVARKVCSQVGIPFDNVLTGDDLARISSTGTLEQFSDAVRKASILAKVSPLQKMEIVQALQNRDHVVGFLGDGINDALALRVADVGISVDSGAEVAKEAANVILLEKSLLILDHAVWTGRKTFANTLKYIYLAASSNFGNVFSVLVASLWVPFIPIQPVMLLTNNFLYDITQGSIPWDHVDKESLEKPKKWQVKDMVYFMLFFGPTSSVFDITTFAIGMYFWGWKDPNNLTQVAQFQTLWFTESLISQTLIVHLLRSRKIPVLQTMAAPVVTIVTTLIVLLGISLPYWALGQKVLGFVAFPPLNYAFLGGIMVGYCTLVFMVKMVYIRVLGKWL